MVFRRTTVRYGYEYFDNNIWIKSSQTPSGAAASAENSLGISSGNDWPPNASSDGMCGKKVLWEGCAWGVDIAKPQSIARFLPYVVVENDRDQALKSNKVSQPLQSTH